MTPEQWHGEAGAIRTQCTEDLVFIGYMYDLSAAPGSLTSVPFVGKMPRVPLGE
ncbi:hypothetical protein ACIRD3_09455 [Kitasatospora sp. NPDC093550]|uniref:hypothetical protein n=1 Tax=Kitasatospora sp. NPDC093550 TaxID=3364089 RepID=UPI0038142B31